MDFIIIICGIAFTVGVIYICNRAMVTVTNIFHIDYCNCVWRCSIVGLIRCQRTPFQLATEG